jgi:predicted nucleotide-binding protein
MPSKRVESKQIGAPKVTPQKGIELLQRQISEGQRLLAAKESLVEDEYNAWQLVTKDYLEKSFGADSQNVSSIMNIRHPGAFPMGADESWWKAHRIKSISAQVEGLNGLIKILRTDIELQGEGSIKREQAMTSNKIFLVHGHDELALQETARFMEKLDQHVVVLREQPNQGHTIIEKFENHADVAFAVVLLTGDDRGGPVATSYDEQKLRARQNVIFELGYFIGRLGRKRVCALYRTGVEIPSDYSGVLYQEFDEKGAWRLALARELKAAGLPVDMNKAL